MSLAFTQVTRWSRFPAILAVVLAGRPGLAPAQTPHIGDIQVLPVINVSLQVGGAGKETKRTTYSPPPGWYIRSHQVMCLQRYGTSSYAVSTVPAGWAWSSEEQFKEMHEGLMDVAAKAHDVAAQLKVNMKRDDAVFDLLRATSGKHALVLETSVTGEGLFRGGSGIQLRVFAEMVYIGPCLRASLGGPVAIEQPVRQVGGVK
ncbi:MAG: hypothetical protein U0793_03980 [Gemmataceae bacterium]